MKKISIAILTLLVVLSACKKVPEVNTKYVDVERDLITVSTTMATLQCDYEYIATLKKAYLYYGEGQEEADMNTAEMRVVQNTLYVDLLGLRENTTYSYYYEFYNGFNSMRTAVKTFKTEVSPAGVTLPTVVTASVIEITTNSAKGGGEVTNDGGAEVTERGICWSTNANPTLSDSHVAAGTGTGTFTAMMNGLEANTTYHVRAYATNEVGTAFGLDREFTTLSGGGSGVPEGAINGLFTINANGDQVYFSQGNLQYQASTNTWRFAEKQWDYVGNENNYMSQSYDGWIDLFGWGTSGYNHGAICYQPWSISTEYDDYNAYGDWQYNLYDQTGKADWGYNPISNGGNIENSGWRTLTGEEMEYLLNTRNTVSGIRYSKAVVNDINGVILLPDDWSTSYYSLNDTNSDSTYFTSNIIGSSEWITLEQHGAVFLPAAGDRVGDFCESIGRVGYYWLASQGWQYFAVKFAFFENPLVLSCGSTYRMVGHSVRLVKNTP